MFKKAAGVLAAATAGLMMAAPLAMADSNDNDGINVLDDNNISAVPVSACGNDVAAVVGAIVNLASPDISQCTNAPILEHVGD